MRLPLLFVRVAVVLIAVVAGFLVARWPESGESIDLSGWPEVLAIDLFLLSMALVAYCWGVRTWWGTALGGLGLFAVWVGGLAAIEADESSTAGIGLLGMPVLALLPVALAIAAENWRRPAALPPPPADD